MMMNTDHSICYCKIILSDLRWYEKDTQGCGGWILRVLERERRGNIFLMGRDPEPLLLVTNVV